MWCSITQRDVYSLSKFQTNGKAKLNTETASRNRLTESCQKVERLDLSVVRCDWVSSTVIRTNALCVLWRQVCAVSHEDTSGRVFSVDQSCACKEVNVFCSRFPLWPRLRRCSVCIPSLSFTFTSIWNILTWTYLYGNYPVHHAHLSVCAQTLLAQSSCEQVANFLFFFLIGLWTNYQLSKSKFDCLRLTTLSNHEVMPACRTWMSSVRLVQPCFFGIPVVILWISLTTACSCLRSLCNFFFQFEWIFFSC